MSLAPVTHPWTAAVIVTAAPFSKAKIIAGHGRTEEEALAQWKQKAQVAEWAPPQWWQWWRRRDSIIVFISASIL